jgi:hypothetical protein
MCGLNAFPVLRKLFATALCIAITRVRVMEC